jgi:hypothetical protein
MRAGTFVDLGPRYFADYLMARTRGIVTRVRADWPFRSLEPGPQELAHQPPLEERLSVREARVRQVLVGKAKAHLRTRGTLLHTSHPMSGSFGRARHVAFAGEPRTGTRRAVGFDPRSNCKPEHGAGGWSLFRGCIRYPVNATRASTQLWQRWGRPPPDS